MPEPHPITLAAGDEEKCWTLNQAIEFLAYRDPQRAREAPVYISERTFRPESLIAWWPSEVVTAVWSVWHLLEERAVTAIEEGRPVPSSRWSAERLSRLAPDEPTALGPFIREVQRSVAHIRISVAELMGLFSASAKPATATVDVSEPVAPRPKDVDFDDDLVPAYQGLIGVAKNREEADAIVQDKDHFNRSIPYKTRVAARQKAGFTGKGGRPKKPGE